MVLGNPFRRPCGWVRKLRNYLVVRLPLKFLRFFWVPMRRAPPSAYKMDPVGIFNQTPGFITTQALLTQSPTPYALAPDALFALNLKTFL